MADGARLPEQLVILADNLQRAAGFYERVFECEVETCADDSCRFVMPAVGPWGAMHAVIRLGRTRDCEITNLFRVQSLEMTTERVLRAHGKVLIACLTEGNSLLSLCEDTEGNQFTIESKRSAR